MMIVEAIDSAPTEHAVYFLVTAYIESLRHFERSCGVPQRAMALPVSGFSDVAGRLEHLRGGLDVGAEAAVASAEVAAVLASALARLATFAQCPEHTLDAGAMRSSRGDSRRSSLSV